MKYIIISFKSRDLLMSFSRLLKSKSIVHSIINTPHNISAGCGLSARIDFNYQQRIMNLISLIKRNALNGVFVIEKINGFERIERLV